MAGPGRTPTSSEKATTTTFDCLWCGRSWTTRGPEDLEGFARLCPDCLGKAGENEFLRFRLRAALEARAARSGRAVEPGADAPHASRAAEAGGSAASARSAGADPDAGDRGPSAAAARSAGADHGAAPRPALSTQPRRAAAPLAPEAEDIDREMVAYYEARAPEYDDWYLRRGRYGHGPIHDTAWNSELDAAGRWLDALPMHGRIVELAAGTGWWSPLLAEKGELWLFDAAEAPLERARDRLLAHRLRAHLHIRDAWAEPDGDPADGLFAGFWLSHVERARTPAFLDLVGRWLAPGGRVAFIDSLPDRQSGASAHDAVATGDRSRRRLADGREFTVIKVHRTPSEVAAELGAAGFVDVEVTTTGRFFVLATGIKP